MDNIWNAFNFSTLLRYFFGGFFCIASFQIGRSSHIECLSEINITNTLFFSLLVGAPIYALHRAILYPVIELLLSSIFKHHPNKNILISDHTIKYILDIWDLDKAENLHKKATIWADNTHLLYSIGWNIYAGLLGIKLLDWNKQDIQFFWHLTLIGLMLLLSGIVSDIRLRVIRTKIINKYLNNNDY